MNRLQVQSRIGNCITNFYSEFVEEHLCGKSDHNDLVVSLCQRIDEISSEFNLCSSDIKVEVAKIARPFFRIGHIIDRAYSKPRGYPGDFLLMHWIHSSHVGTGLAGAWDRTFLSAPSACAVKNRSHFIASIINNELENFGESCYRILTLGSGPAHELDDLIRLAENALQIEITFLDIDNEALSFIRQRFDAIKPNVKLSYRCCDVRQSDAVQGGPYHCIYSAGLFDYLNDSSVVSVLNAGYSQLIHNGLLVLGNFCDNRTIEDKFSMDYIMDWRLRYRDENSLRNLAAASRFKFTESVLSEPTGINLFAILRRD